MSPVNYLSKLAGAAITLGISLTPGIANAFSLTFNPPNSNSLTITDRAGRGGDSNDTSSLKNYIQFNQTFGDIQVSGTLFGEYINFTRSQDESNVALSADGTEAIILTLTDFELKNNGNTNIDVADFINISAATSDFSDSGNLIGLGVDFYLNYKGYYNQSVGTSNVSGSYSVGYVNNPTINLAGTTTSGNNFSRFDSNSNSGELNVSDIYMDILNFNLAAGASIVLPDSLVSMITVDDERSPLTSENVEQLSHLVKAQFAAQSVPEPSSLIGLLALGGLFTLGYKKGR